MRIKLNFLSSLLMLCAFFAVPCSTVAQTNGGPSPIAQLNAPRVTQPVDESNLVVLHGNTHPLALPKYDQGPAPASLPMQRMLLVLQRSATQESALEQLLEQQQDNSSPNYHQWLTPQQFGAQFGPADQDIQTVTAWLQSHGFQVARVSAGRVVIEFSGTAGQVAEAFHTSIHKYAMNGREHWANASDPQIPAALAPVVAGVESLNSFPRMAQNHVGGVFSKSKSTGKITPVKPLLTILNSNCGVKGNCYGIGPYDFAEIYNLLPLWDPTSGTAVDGTGQTIAIVGETDISLADVTAFRNFLGISSSAGTVNVIHDGPPPGILTSGGETESDLDVQWSGGVAKGATIDFVVSTSTETTPGIDLSAEYIVDNNLAGAMSESYGECELGLGTSGNQYFAELWEQASAEGITVFVSAGDSGSSGCDNHRGVPPSPAEFGLQVSGHASTPYDVAVGGTDFNDAQNPGTYWGSTNAPSTQESALGYIPETTWNDTCTNGIFLSLGFSSDAEANCNDPQLIDFVSTLGGGGGTSNCTTSAGEIVSTCSGGYAEPSWQTGAGTGGNRKIPDVSLYAAIGSPSGAGYIVCEADALEGASSCDPSNPSTEFLLVGGTSASSPAFAGIMALINQKTGERQGNANYVFYKMAAGTDNSCNSTTVSSTGTNACIFYDVTNGTNEMPCATGSPNCTTNSPGDAYGVLSAYHTGTGYDEATGLGSVNVTNLVNQWSTYAGQFKATTINPFTLGPPTVITHGQLVPVAATVKPQTGTGTPTGTITLIANTGSASSGQQAAQQVFILNSSGSIAAGATTILLPGGTNEAVKAHYSGDSTFAPSDSSPVTMTVNPEVSKSQVVVEIYNPTNGQITNSNATSFVYGTPTILRANVTNASGNLCAPTGIEVYGCPTGSVTLTDTLNGTPSQIGTAPFGLNSEGYSEDQSLFLFGGLHSIVASYNGDNNYSASTVSGSSATPDVVTVTPAPTTIGLSASQSTIQAGEGVSVTATVVSQIYVPSGAPSYFPSEDVQFFQGSTQFSGQINYVPGSNPTAQLVAYIDPTTLSIGNNTFTAKFLGDANYSPSGISNSVTVDLVIPTTTTIGTSSPSIQHGSPVTFTATVVPSQSGGPAMTGTMQFWINCFNCTSIGNVPIVNGQAQITTSTLPGGALTIIAGYSGDTDYASSSGGVSETVNLIGTTTGLTSSNQMIQQGGSVTFTAQITPAQSGGPTMTGSVSFVTAGSAFGNQNISNSQAQVATTTIPLGTDSIVANYSGDTNYAPSSATLTETVTAAPTFGVSASPTPVPITAPGSSGTATLTFTGMNGYSGTIPLSGSLCSGMPAETTCSFGPSSVVLSSSATTATATVTFQTTAASGVLPQSNKRPGDFRWWTLGGSVAFVACIFSLGMIVAGYRRGRLRLSSALALLAFAAVLAMASCGGGGTTGPPPPPPNSGTPVGLDQNVVITFNGAGVTPSPTLDLSVNVE